MLVVEFFKILLGFRVLSIGSIHNFPFLLLFTSREKVFEEREENKAIIFKKEDERK